MPAKAKEKAKSPRRPPPQASSPGRPKAQPRASARQPSPATSAVRPKTGLGRQDDSSPRRRSLVTRQNGTERRRTTVYFEPGLARRLNVYCATHDLEMSQVVGEAVEALLRKKGE